MDPHEESPAQRGDRASCLLLLGGSEHLEDSVDLAGQQAHRRRQMADALKAASRCLAETCKSSTDSATSAALQRAARRYIARFNDLASGNAA